MSAPTEVRAATIMGQREKPLPGAGRATEASDHHVHQAWNTHATEPTSRLPPSPKCRSVTGQTAFS